MEIIASELSGGAPFTVYFTASAPNPGQTGFEWNFGDGRVSHVPKTFHTFVLPGLKEAVLTGFLAWGPAVDPGLMDAVEILRPPTPTRAPEFALPDLNGRTVELRAFRGRIVLLNFWATWCPPCVVEMPSLERLSEEFKKAGLVVVGINDIPTAREEVRDQILQGVKVALAALPGVVDAKIEVRLPASEPQREEDPFAGRAPIPGVRWTLAVASGKGGVGKSIIAVNLALAEMGAQVGVLDADIYGPSLPTMLGVREVPMSVDGRYLPIRKDTLRLMSMGFLIPETDPVIWRGPLVMGMVRDFLRKVAWGTLDYLVVDLPPGTGDVQLTLVQELPLSGAVIVTTPSDVALIDARKALAMFRRVRVPVLGIVENMSYFACPGCGLETGIFGRGAGRRVAEVLEVPLLAEIPLDEELRRAGSSSSWREGFGRDWSGPPRSVHRRRSCSALEPKSGGSGPNGRRRTV